MQLAIHYMTKNSANGAPSSSNGLIVCTASNAGIYPFPIAPIYAATKAAVIGLVRSLARRLETERIRINALAPAVIGRSTLEHITVSRFQERDLWDSANL